jgi:Ni,Fe-hydrogenase III small subunit
MILEREVPLNLQFRPDKKVLDEGIAKAKAALLNDIKRSIYLYRVDCGGCNGCEIEIFSTITTVFDAERFGIKNTPSPRHADILVYTGAMTRSMRMPAIRAYQGAPDPKLVVSYGACGCTGGIFHDNYCVWGGTDKLFPVDVYIPGCPPSPPQTIYGFAIALGLLGQKLHHSELVEGADEQVPFRFEDIPYKMRVAFERKARLYAGYRTGLELAEEFMEALRIEGSGSSERVDALIAQQTDPRRAEVLVQLKIELDAILKGLDVEPRPLLEQASSGA